MLDARYAMQDVRESLLIPYPESSILYPDSRIQNPEYWEVLVSVIFALAGGALAGWVLTRGRRGVLAGGLATLVLAMAMGGPLPITATPRAAGLFASFLAIYTLCGAALVVIRAGLARATSHPSTAVT